MRDREREIERDIVIIIACSSIPGSHSPAFLGLSIQHRRCQDPIELVNGDFVNPIAASFLFEVAVLCRIGRGPVLEICPVEPLYLAKREWRHFIIVVVVSAQMLLHHLRHKLVSLQNLDQVAVAIIVAWIVCPVVTEISNHSLGIVGVFDEISGEALAISL